MIGHGLKQGFVLHVSSMTLFDTSVACHAQGRRIPCQRENQLIKQSRHTCTIDNNNSTIYRINLATLKLCWKIPIILKGLYPHPDLQTLWRSNMWHTCTIDTPLDVVTLFK
jgi:hypothetical protein